MLDPGKIPVQWNAEDFYTLDYKKDTIKTTYSLQQYIASGHREDCIEILNYFEPNPMPDGVEQTRAHFELLGYRNISIAVNLFNPGKYVPLHKDLYSLYKQTHNLDGETIHRYILMLEKNEHGQILQIGNNCIGDWHAGDYFGWADSAHHAFYNFSMTPRHALQITATL